MFSSDNTKPVVVIATTNPGKIKAVKDAFEQMHPGLDIQYQSISVPSGVPDQPMTSEETLTGLLSFSTFTNKKGAINRVKNAKKAIPQADYWVGIEGGLDPV